MKKKRQEEAQEPKKEQKIIYIDDGSSVADMSGTYKRGKAPRQRSTFREKARTFFGVMKKMILPMLCTLLAFTLIFILLLAVTGKL